MVVESVYDRCGSVGPSHLVGLLICKPLIVVRREPAIEPNAIRDHQDNILCTTILCKNRERDHAGERGREKQARSRHRQYLVPVEADENARILV